MTTTYGTKSVHLYFERVTWHVGQHLRQLGVLLDMSGTVPPERISDELFKGLPMPEKAY